MKRAAAFALIITLLTACSPAWDMPPLVVLPGDSSGAPTPVVPDITLPDGAASSRGFGLAWTPVDRLDPIGGRDTLNTALLPLLYDGLFVNDEAFETRPNLCASVITEDNTVFTLTLRNAVFSDGAPLQAEDVVHSLNLARADASPYSGRFENVISAKAGDGTVIIELSAPKARFASLLDFPIIPASSDKESAAPPGTGPYILGYDGDTGQAILTPNPFRAGHEELNPYRIELLDARDPVNLSFYFQYRHIAAVDYDYNDPLLPGLHSGGDRFDYPTSVMQYIGVNAALPPAESPLAWPDFRRALSMALDRESLCEGVFGGYADPALLPVPPSSALYDAEVSAGYGFDSSAARRILADAGCTDGDADGILEWPVSARKKVPLSFTLLVNTGNELRAAAAREWADALMPLGIALNVSIVSWAQYTSAIESGDFDLFWAQTRLSPDFGADAFLSPDDRALSGAVLNAAADAAEAADARREVYASLLERGNCITACFNRKTLLTQRGMFRAPTPAASAAFYGFTEWGITIDN
ncbi:MAG: ABC transporter substrate-binding protein [Oscillospiraceae bacterium]|jgi:peptide/nickel transport system substrate-binding protein|nr:ABC transporter substrate-binding protein [Oscillospiraceae bacterium]